MKLEERVHKLHELSKDLEKLSRIVQSMSVNEDAPVYNTEWGRELMEKYNAITEHANSLKKDVGLW